jgi:hypothetical protein
MSPMLTPDVVTRPRLVGAPNPSTAQLGDAADARRFAAWAPLIAKSRSTDE